MSVTCHVQPPVLGVCLGLEPLVAAWIIELRTEVYMVAASYSIAAFVTNSKGPV